MSNTTTRQFTCTLYIHGYPAREFQRDSFPDTYGPVLRAPEGSRLCRRDNQTGNTFWYMKREGKWGPITKAEVPAAAAAEEKGMWQQKQQDQQTQRWNAVEMILSTVAKNCERDDPGIQHYREILDDIISDLQQYADTLPTADELFAANKL